MYGGEGLNPEGTGDTNTPSREPSLEGGSSRGRAKRRKDALPTVAEKIKGSKGLPFEGGYRGISRL